MAKKFIIITTHRSGSQMLCEFLTNQKNIICEYELLQPDKEIKYTSLQKKAELFNNIEIQKKLANILGNDPSKFVINRNRNFEEYLKLWEDVVPSKYFGFKAFFEYHLKNYWLPPEDSIKLDDFLKYIKKNNIKIIHLTRDNILLKYISWLTSQVTRVSSCSWGNKINSDKNNIVSVNVSYDKYTKYKINLLKEEADAVCFCLLNNIEYHRVAYENLIGDDHVVFYKDIMKFLGEDPEVFIDIKDTENQNKRKANVFSLSQKVLNLGDFIKEATIADDKELLENIEKLKQ